MFTTLSPCDICAALIYRRQFHRLVVGGITNFAGNEDMLRQKGVLVDILEDPDGVAFFAKYLKEKPDQHMEDAYGLAAVRKGAAPKSQLGPGQNQPKASAATRRGFAGAPPLCFPTRAVSATVGELNRSTKKWLGGLDSNQDNQIQNLMYCQLYDLPIF